MIHIVNPLPPIEIPETDFRADCCWREVCREKAIMRRPGVLCGGCEKYMREASEG